VTPRLPARVTELAGAIGQRLDGKPLVVMLDIDGTLAPIARTPADAVIPPPTRELLRRLATLPGVCLVFVTGRSITDALRMLEIEGASIIGNHGFELRSADGTISAEPAVVPFERAIASAERDLQAMAAERKGVLLENKRWTLSVHYRLAADADVPSVIAAVTSCAEARGLRLTHGKKVVELRPPIEVHKGTATRALAQQLGALKAGASLVFAGDDRTDEDAFVSLRDAKPDAVTIRIASRESGPASSAAEFSLADPDDLRAMLQWLVAHRTDR
jgi:trehalose-phosphatase